MPRSADAPLFSHPNYFLKHAREKRGWSQEYVAEQLGTTTRTVGRWEQGVTKPYPHYCHKLSILFGMTERELGLDATATLNTSQTTKLAFVPAAPSFVIGRDSDLDAGRRCLLRSESVVITGLPGIGKTTLATLLARHQDIQEAFEGVLWIALGQHPNILKQLDRCAVSLGISQKYRKAQRGPQQWRATLQEALASRKMVLVIDDVWDLADLQPFLIGNPSCPYLITTRLRHLALESGIARLLYLHELDNAQSVHLLRMLVPHVVEAEEQAAEALAQMVGGLPLALNLVGHFLRRQTYTGQSRRIAHALALLTDTQTRLQLQGPLTTDPLPGTSMSLQSTIELSDQALSSTARQTLYFLALLPAKPATFSEAIGRAIAACQPETLDELVDAGLVEPVGDSRYSVHQTIAHYGKQRLSEERQAEGITRLIAYTIAYLEAHTQDFEVLTRETATIFTVLTALHLRGEHENLVKAVLLFAPAMLANNWYDDAASYLALACEAAKAHQCESATLYLYLGKARYSQGRRTEAMSDWQTALSLARAHNNTRVICDLLANLCWILYLRGEYSALPAYLAEALPLASQYQQSQAYCRLLLIHAFREHDMGNYLQAEKDLVQGLPIALALNLQTEIPLYYLGLAARPTRRGDYWQAEWYHEQGITAAIQGNEEQTICLHLIYRSAMRTMYRAGQDLRQDLSSALQIVEKAKNSGYCALVLRTWSTLELVLKNWEKAEMYADQGLHHATIVNAARLQGMLLTCLAQVALARGQTHIAETHLEKALPLVRANCECNEVARTLCVTGELSLFLHRATAAQDAFQEAQLVAPAEHVELQAWIMYGLARSAQGMGLKHLAGPQAVRALQLFAHLHHYRFHEVQAWVRTHYPVRYVYHTYIQRHRPQNPKEHGSSGKKEKKSSKFHTKEMKQMTTREQLLREILGKIEEAEHHNADAPTSKARDEAVALIGRATEHLPESDLDIIEGEVELRFPGAWNHYNQRQVNEQKP